MPYKPKKPDVPGRDVIERRAALIASHRFVVLSISATLLAMALMCAVVMRIIDPNDFPTLGGALWWAVETFTTVGYGDVVPTTTAGKIVGGLLMVVAIMFLSFLTAATTTTLIRRAEVASRSDSLDSAAILGALERLERRLDAIEKRLGA